MWQATSCRSSEGIGTCQQEAGGRGGGLELLSAAPVHAPVLASSQARLRRVRRQLCTPQWLSSLFPGRSQGGQGVPS